MVVENIRRVLRRWHTSLTSKRMRADWLEDGLAVKGRITSFFDDPKFSQAWKFAVEGNQAGWRGKVPKIRWRAHVCVWAAKHGLTLDGDFIECGVHTGILSMCVADYLDFSKTDRKFYLFDTYKGIPLGGLVGKERQFAKIINEKIYFDVYEITKNNFLRFSNVVVVKGVLPDSLRIADLDRVAYLSVDLNSATYERQVMEELWDRLSPGAITVIDDYGFRGHEEQYEMWNTFAAERNRMVMSHPSGQGILVK